MLHNWNDDTTIFHGMFIVDNKPVSDLLVYLNNDKM